ncbi:RNA-binding protein [Runella rosea]|uniref:RNA-binding protein n=1 Tax=Runella rosea TaxID=2259595 RepID=A0A344TG37_9BACT|nr:VCBS repeat-containing protein [Runella rosea]AXE17608.1 RNA-binding protein [Runella rosea]
MKSFPFLILIFVFYSCSPSDSVFEKLDASHTGIDFVNKIEETEQDNVLNYEYFYNGGGVAAADFNNDGFTDLYFTANQGEDKLYLNKGKLAFEDITQTAGIAWNGEWKTGVTVVDINNDGWQDVYVSVSGNVDHPELRRNKLYVNNGKSEVSFTEKAKEYGLDLATFTTQTAFFDYDNDGDLDAYVLNHNVKDFKRFDVEAVHAMRDSLAGDRLMRNDSGKFTDVSSEAGIKGNPIGFGLGISTADVNGDGWLDIYISNDYIENDYLYINNQNGTFTDQITEATNHVSYFSMGNDIGDVNNDLMPDIITMDMLPEDNKRQKLLFGPDKYEAYLSMLRNGLHNQTMRNMLQLNISSRPDGVRFSEIGQVAGISNTDWSWSALLADYDNDGYQDLFVTNGYLRDYTNNDFIKYYAEIGENNNQSVLEVIKKMPSTKTPNYIFKNNQNLTFSNKQTEWGFDTPVISNGAVYADLDNDGDLEIVTNNINEPAYVYQNKSSESGKVNYLTVQLPSSRAVNGTKVYVYCGDLQQYRAFTPTHGYESSMMTPVHFGLGTHKTVDSLVVIWPDGKMQKQTNVAANQVLKLTYAPNANWSREVVVTPLFVENKNLDFEHQQMPVNDFSRQLLLPQMYSYQGPRMAKGDLNKDGLEDIYIGGGKGQPGAVFLQQKGESGSSSRFVRKEQPAFKQDELCTDTDAVFFDADKDGDLDLFVTSGGYEYLPNDFMLQNRLYLNDGKGNFTKNADAIPADKLADSAVEVIDFDRDGDLDLFVTGGAIPQEYPRFNPARLYRNEGGKFTNVANPAFENLGVLTDVCVLDFDKDGYDDIVAVGEWTPIIRLKNEKGVFKKVTDGLDKTIGFWQSIAANDFDNDGDMDLIVGNYGLNTQWKASFEQPMTLHTDDFDSNGRLDPILSYFIQGKSYPAYSKDELSDQLVPLKKAYTSHESYASATTDDVLAIFKDKKPQKQEINTLSTMYLVNNKGSFEMKALPMEAQFAPVYAILTEDLNGDGFKDLLLAGNQTHGRVRIGNIDANFGQVFFNDKKGGFRYLPQHQSGLYLKGEVRGLVFVNNQLVVAKNSGLTNTFIKK